MTGGGRARTLAIAVVLACGCATLNASTPSHDLAVSGPLATRVAAFDADLRAGRGDQALARVDRAIEAAERGARTTDDYTELGYMLVRLGRGGDARRYLDLAVSHAAEPRAVMLAHIWSARAHVLLEDFAAAARDYAAALAAADRIPGGTPTLLYATVDVALADVQRLRGDCKQAVANYERLSKLAHPRNAVASDRDVAHRVWAGPRPGSPGASSSGAGSTSPSGGRPSSSSG